MRMRMEEKYVKRRTVLEVLATQLLIAVYVGTFLIWFAR